MLLQNQPPLAGPVARRRFLVGLGVLALTAGCGSPKAPAAANAVTASSPEDLTSPTGTSSPSIDAAPTRSASPEPTAGTMTSGAQQATTTTAGSVEPFEISYTDAQWRQRLTPEQYNVLREDGTEAPFSSPLDDEHDAGDFSCAGCDLNLFSSDAKFDSGTGWPSFWQVMDDSVLEIRDTSAGMVRVEVRCRRCGGHIGHVFDDGPQPTGLRYCMNGVAMVFHPGE